jgi:hypothetical protein
MCVSYRIVLACHAMPVRCRQTAACGVDGQRGCTALLLACGRGSLDVARFLVAEARSDVLRERENVRHCCRWHGECRL